MIDLAYLLSEKGRAEEAEQWYRGGLPKQAARWP